MSVALTLTVFAGSAFGLSTVAAPPTGACVKTARTAELAYDQSGFNVRSVVKPRFSQVGIVDLKPDQKATNDAFECGMCGGAMDGCPACRGPSFNALNSFDLVVEAPKPKTNDAFECGVCGGAMDGCPACGSL